MNENLNLVKILKDCPKGTKLYSLIHGEVRLNKVKNPTDEYPILVTTEACYNNNFTIDGRYYSKYKNSECILFPSKDQRDWSKFKVPVEKFDYSTLKPFDKVLVRDSDHISWRCNFLSHLEHNGAYCVSSVWDQMIPYNEETKHLLGTSDMPDKKYIWWKK